MVETAIILAAGRGSRLDPSGALKEFSKPLIEVGGRSLLHRAIAACVQVGISKIIVVTGYRQDLVKEAVDALNTNAQLDTIHNEAWREPNGLSLRSCRHSVTGDFVLLMADHLFDVTILSDLCALANNSVACTLAVDYKLESILDIDDATKILTEGEQIREIGKSLARYNAVDCGLFYCTPAVFDALDHAIAGNRLSISDAMRELAKANEFHALDVGERIWQDVDTPEMAAHAERLFGDS